FKLYCVHRYLHPFPTRRSSDLDSFNQWNEFISAAKNSVFLFNRNYMDYHQDRFNDHSLLISKSGKLVAVLPAHEKEKEIFSHAGDRKSTRLNSSHVKISYAVFC